VSTQAAACLNKAAEVGRTAHALRHCCLHALSCCDSTFHSLPCVRRGATVLVAAGNNWAWGFNLGRQFRPAEVPLYERAMNLLRRKVCRRLDRCCACV
jgi:hypothetical protein